MQSQESLKMRESVRVRDLRRPKWLLTLRMEVRPQSKECRQPLVAERVKERDSP